MNIYKVRITLLLSMLTFTISIAAQSVGIGTTTPHPSAALDIVDTQKGVLLPKLTSAQRLAIANPSHSLLVFDVDTNSFWWRDTERWVELTSATIGLRDADADTGIFVEETDDADEIAFDIAGVERARLFDDQFYLNGKMSLGTSQKRGLLTLRGPDDPEFGPSIFMYGNGSDQVESGRIRWVEGTAGINWRGGYMHYDGLSNLFHMGVHNASDNNITSDYNALTVKRINGFIGINNENPTHRLTVDGDIKTTTGQVILETYPTGINLIAGSTTIQINQTGGIIITSSSGDIDMTGNNINITAAGDLNITAGHKIDLNSGTDFTLYAIEEVDLLAGTNMIIESGNAMQHSAGTSMNSSAGSGYTVQSSGSYSVSAGATMNLNAALMLLNGNTSSKAAARLADKTSAPVSGSAGIITTGSSTVRIGG